MLEYLIVAFFVLGLLIFFLGRRKCYVPAEKAREHIKEKVYPLFGILDSVKIKSGKEFTITKISLSEESGKFFYAGPGTKWFSEEMLTPVDIASLTERVEEELFQEASINPQTYLSRLDKWVDADEAIKYWGKPKLLDEIGMTEAIRYYGEEELLEEIGQIKVKNYWGT